MTAHQGPADTAEAAPGVLTDREPALVAAFTDITEAMTARADVDEVLARLVDASTELLGARSAAMLLIGPGGRLVVVAASSSEHAALEHFALQADEGPCLTCARLGAPVVVRDLVRDGAPWPTWSLRARADGILSSYAFPMRARGGAVGVLNVLGDRADLLTERDLLLAAALVSLATAAVTVSRDSREGAELTSQLQHALDSRVVIEQAKGVVATALGTSMDEAFTLIRARARSTNRRLGQVAGDLTTGRLGSDQLRSTR